MPLDPSQHTTSEWFERTLMVVGVALFFAALLVTGPLTGVIGFLDDPSGDGSAPANESDDSDVVTDTGGIDGEEPGTSSQDDTRADGGTAAPADDEETEEHDEDGDKGDHRGDEGDDRRDTDDDADESDDDDGADDEDAADDEDSEDGDDSDDPGRGEGKAKGHEKDRGNGRDK